MGNEVYPRNAAVGLIDEHLLQENSAVVHQVMQKLLPTARTVIVLGHLPRLAMEVLGCPWERTAAHHLEHCLKSVPLLLLQEERPLGHQT